MNYAVIAAEMSAAPWVACHPGGGAAGRVARGAFAWTTRSSRDGARANSTENRSTAERYLGYLLDGLGVTDPAIVDKIVAWRRAYNPPVGIWNTVDPDAAQALDDVRRAGLRAAVISNSNGSVRSILESSSAGRSSRLRGGFGEEGVEKPDPRSSSGRWPSRRVAPGEAVYIGDLYSIDVRGARAAGLRACPAPTRAGHWGARELSHRPRPLAGAIRPVLTGA
jgi:FMN phosphatase YigB (HAD superfamily)